MAHLVKMNFMLDCAAVIKSAVSDLNNFVQKNDPVQQKLVWNGIPINLEWLAGQKRDYENVPESEQRTLAAHYGYIRGTDTDDGEELDVYLNPGSQQKTVFILIQLDGDGENYDEIKFMLGFDDSEDAQEAYITGMPARMFGAIFPVDWNKFKKDCLAFYKE